MCRQVCVAGSACVCGDNQILWVSTVFLTVPCYHIFMLDPSSFINKHKHTNLNPNLTCNPSLHMWYVRLRFQTATNIGAVQKRVNFISAYVLFTMRTHSYNKHTHITPLHRAHKERLWGHLSEIDWLRWFRSSSGQRGSGDRRSVTLDKGDKRQQIRQMNEPQQLTKGESFSSGRFNSVCNEFISLSFALGSSQPLGSCLYLLISCDFVRVWQNAQ